MKNLQNATVVITGASSGIGQATAEEFARHRGRLVLAARGVDALEEVAEICRRRGAMTISVPTDTTDPQAVRRLAERALEFGGGIDIWFSNVGVGAVGRFQDVPIEVHRQVVEANLISHMNDAHAVIPILVEQRRGVFINMNSLGAFAAAPYAASYSAGKFGLRGFTSALRAEMSEHPGIHVCDVYPTFVDTPGIPHAANYTGRKLTAPPPVYDARRVARAVVDLAQRPRNSVSVGAPAKLLRMGHVLVPQSALNLTATLTRMALARAPQSAITTGNVLAPPARAGGIDGGLRSSAETRAVAAAGAGLAVGALILFALQQGRRNP